MRPLSIPNLMIVATILVAPLGMAQAAPKHLAMHEALYNLREARSELKDAASNFGGHKEKALSAIDAAIKQLDLALLGAGDNVKGFKPKNDNEKKFPNHPRMHNAIQDLAQARNDLKEAKHDFGGHRDNAIRDIDAAIVQLELALRFANKK